VATGYTRQSAAQIVDDADVTAAIFNAEYNQLQSAMDASSGHNHDGTTGGGAPIPLGSAVSGQLPLANGGTGANLTDPGADRIVFWDDSATAITWLQLGTGLSITDTTLGFGGPIGSIAGLTTAADKMIYTTASDTYAVADLTSFARSLLDDADAATVRTTLGLGTVAVEDTLPIAQGGTGATTAGAALTALGAEPADADILKADTTDELQVGYSTSVHNLGTKSSGTEVLDEANGAKQRIVNGGAFTLSPPTNYTNIELYVENNASAGTITTSGFTWTDGDTITTTDGHKFIFNISTTYDGTSTVSTLNVRALQ